VSTAVVVAAAAAAVATDFLSESREGPAKSRAFVFCPSLPRAVDPQSRLATLAIVKLDSIIRAPGFATLIALIIGLAGLLSFDLAAATKPNIVVILVDDMGYSDIGCYGGEINTPNLDKLAQTGVRFTQFHNTARCCPTRAALLTGLYPHQAGVGHMTQEHHDADGHLLAGYSGRLNDHCLTIGN